MENKDEFSPVVSARLYEIIVEQIEIRIAEGNLAIGDRLPSERELARQFGVSRPVIRESIKILRQKGLVEVRSGSGVFIADNTTTMVRNSLDLMITMGRRSASGELVEARELLEGVIARLAAGRRTEEDMADLVETIKVLETCGNDIEAAAMADLEFHQTIARASENRYLAILLNTINESLYDARFSYFSISGAREESLADHKAILQAIQDQNPDQCSRVMSDHVRKIRKAFFENGT